MRRTALCLSIAICGSVQAQMEVTAGCGVTTPEVNACVQRKVDKADTLLNEIYGVVIKELSAGTDDPNPVFNNEIKRTLISAEREWVKFQDAQCTVEATLVAPGTAAPAVAGQCMINLINERIRFLKRVAAQIHSESKLCRTNEANCVLQKATIAIYIVKRYS